MQQKRNNASALQICRNKILAVNQNLVVAVYRRRMLLSQKESGRERERERERERCLKRSSEQLGQI